jgi:hypothetical protein
MLPYTAVNWKRKSIDWTARYSLSVSQQRIALFAQAIELAAHQPRALNELKLARYVGVETDELKTARQLT